MTPPRKRVSRVCEQCGESFEVWPSVLRKGRGKFCSRACKGLGSRRVNNIHLDGDAAYLELVNRKGECIAEAIVDATDAPRLLELGLCWRAQWDESSRDYYVTAQARGADKTGLVLHRWLMDAPPHLQVDHINHNRLDNRCSINLRLCTPGQNGQNRKGAVRGSVSGIRNVNWCKSSGKWMVRVMVDSKSTYVGMYHNLEEAEAAAKEARRTYMTHSLD